MTLRGKKPSSGLKNNDFFAAANYNMSRRVSSSHHDLMQLVFSNMFTVQKLHEYSLESGVSLFKAGAVEEVKGNQLIFIYYEVTDVKEIEEIPILSVWGFISSCGGTLGLFLGFSCHSAIFYLLLNVEKRIPPSQASPNFKQKIKSESPPMHIENETITLQLQ